MTNNRSIIVLFHKTSKKFSYKNYEIELLAKFWRQQGRIVQFVFGTDKYIPADICFVHVDLSVVPDNYLEFANRYPVVINGRVKDIRKTTFSKNLLSRTEPYDGPVIVKSDLNFAGWPEKKASKNRIVLVASRLKSIFSRTGDYLLFDNPKEVPGRFYDDPNLVVEKFLPEFDGEFYYLRVLHFLGDNIQCFRDRARSPIVKAKSVISTEAIEPDEKILLMRSKLNFDYGKFDYCIHDGKAILFDTNKTIGLSRLKLTDWIESRYEEKSTGINSY